MYMYVIFYSLHQSMALRVALYNLLLYAVHKLRVKLEFFVHIVVHQNTLCSVACNKLECDKGVVVTY